MKKIGAFLLAILLIASSVMLFACGKDKTGSTSDGKIHGAFTLDKTSAEPGESVKGTLELTENPGFNVMIIRFVCPENTLEMVDVSENEDSGFDITSGKSIIIDAGNEDSHYTGKVFDVEFKLSEKAAEDFKIEVYCDAARLSEVELESVFNTVEFKVITESAAGYTDEETESDASLASVPETSEVPGAKELFEEEKAKPFSFMWNYGLINYYKGEIVEDSEALDSGVWGWIGLAGALVIGYLFGSVNFAIVISKLVFHEDIREKGSGNAGMTNMMRTYGSKYAALTLLGDFLKTALAVVIGRFLLGMPGAYAAGLGAVVGHMWPAYYKFKGGKGIAASFALVMMTYPFVGGILFVLFVAVVAFTKYLSLGSIMGVLVFPFLLSRITDASFIELICALLIAILVVIKHKDNIKRLYSGQENKFSFKKSEKKSEQKTEQ